MDPSRVLDFLKHNGFHRAAEAFLDDVLARGGFDALDLGDTQAEEIVVVFPPVRTESSCRSGGGNSRLGYSSSGDDDAFVSIGSSPSGSIGQHEPCCVENAESISSDTRSESCTTRSHNGSNGFGVVNCCSAKCGGCGKDPCLALVGCPEQLEGGAHAGCEDCSKVNGVVLPRYDTSCSELKDLCNGDSVELVLDSGDSVVWSTSRSRMVTRELVPPLKLADDVPVPDYWEADLRGCSGCMSRDVVENLDLKLFDKELHMLRVGEGEQKGFEEVDTDCDLNFDLCESQNPNCQIKNNIVTVANRNKTHCNKDVCISDQPSLEDVNGVFELNEDQNINAVTNDGLDKDLKDEGDTPDDLQMLDGHEDEFEIFELRIVHRKNRTGFEESRDMPIILNSLIAGRYYAIDFLGSAAFSKVIQAHDLHTGADVCLKIIKNDKDFFDQSLDEIKLLKFVNKHDPADEHHVLRLYDYFYHQEHLFIVCELLKANLYEFQKYNQDSDGEMYFTLPRIQAIARQCLEALQYLHRLGIIHCDLKPENILIKSYSRCEIKIIDLGSSCFYSDNLCLYVQSRSYRAPEVILGLSYDQKIDMWSLGCILAELFSGNVLFPNESLGVLLSRVIGFLGPIDKEMLDMGQETHKYFTKEHDIYSRNEETGNMEYIIPQRTSLSQQLGHPDSEFVNFLEYLLEINPQRRPTATEALEHPWFSYSYS